MRVRSVSGRMSRGAQDKEREIVRIVHTYTYVRRVEEAGLGLNLEARVVDRERGKARNVISREHS